MVARIFSVLLLVLFCSRISAACTCASPSPKACPGLGPTEVIFVGTLIDIENPAPDDGGLGGPGLSRYHFTIDENIAGAQGSEIDIFSGRGGADCSYHFKQGQQYLVFPYRGDDSRLFATICSPTRPIDQAQAILPQLRAMRDHQRVASVYGILRSSQQPYEYVWDDRLDRILPNTRLELRSEDKTFVAVTDSNGAYAFYGVPEGEYHFAGELPENLEFAQVILGGPLPPLKLPTHACFESDLTALPSGRIRGRVLGPMASHLFSQPSISSAAKNTPRKFPMADGMRHKTGTKGTSSSRTLAPGDYVLIYNSAGRIDEDEPYQRTFYPGVADLKSAKVIHLEGGQKFDDADIRVSDGRPTREIIVRLVAETGELPDINYVEGKGSDGQTTSEEAVSPGAYTISIFKDVRYEFHGQGYCSATNKETATESIQVDGSDERATELTLVFLGAGCPRNPSDDSK